MINSAPSHGNIDLDGNIPWYNLSYGKQYHNSSDKIYDTISITFQSSGSIVHYIVYYVELNRLVYRNFDDHNSTGSTEILYDEVCEHFLTKLEDKLGIIIR